MSRIFYNNKGKEVDILHSTYFNGLSFKERQDLAFNKEELAKLNNTDKLLMRGYAQNISERTKAFYYNNPDYVPKKKKQKSSQKNAKSTKKN